MTVTKISRRAKVFLQVLWLCYVGSLSPFSAMAESLLVLL